MSLIYQKRNIFTRISILLSSLCVVHCLATPFLLVLIPAISTFFSESLERILVLSVIPLSLIGFAPTWLRHKDYHLVIVYAASIMLILFGQFFLHVNHDQLVPGSIPVITWLRSGVTLTGALLLAWAVYKNNRHTHYCTHPHHHQNTARPRPESSRKNISVP